MSALPDLTLGYVVLIEDVYDISPNSCEVAALDDNRGLHVVRLPLNYVCNNQKKRVAWKSVSTYRLAEAPRAHDLGRFLSEFCRTSGGVSRQAKSSSISTKERIL